MSAHGPLQWHSGPAFMHVMRLEMAVMRIRIRHPNEPVAPHEEAFKLQPPEVPVRNKVCDCILQQTLAHANHGHILALQPSKIPTNGA